MKSIKEVIKELMKHGGFSYLMSIANKLPNDTERKICCLGSISAHTITSF